MKYKKYPSYKDSGVAWLGEVPEHWSINSLKSLLQERKETNSPVKTKDILSLCMYRGVIPYSEKGNSGNKAKEDLTAYKLAYPGDIVLNSMNVVAGSVGLSKYFGAVSPVYYMLRPRSNKNSVEFFNNIFQSESFQKSLFGLGNGIMVKQSEATGKLNTIRMRIPMDKLNTVLIPSPPVLEQQQIANFLDNATQKIDTLITKQEKLIELLKEKRQAVISHAVTKGLNPDVKMKDSGIEWLGDVPMEWKISKLRYYLNGIKDGTHGSHKNTDTGELLLSGKNIKYGKLIIKDNERKISIEDHRQITANGYPKKGDLLVSVVGTIGQTYVYELDKPISFQRSVCFLRSRKDVDNYFLEYEFNSSLTTMQLNLLTNKSTIGGVYMGDIVELVYAFPSLLEQEEIAIYLDDKTKKIDTLIEKSKQSIKLLKEKRTALISAAVTGKIDVRGIEC